MKYALILLTLLCNLASAQEVKKGYVNMEGLQSDYKTLSRKYYSITFPSTWMTDTSKGNKFSAVSPPDSDKLINTVNLQIDDLSLNPMSLDKYLATGQAQIKEITPDMKLLSNTKLHNEN